MQQMANKLLLLLMATAMTAAQSARMANIDALHLMPFHPISRAEYDAILGLTNGEQTISEARLVSSGIAALNRLVASVKAGLSGTFLASWMGGIQTPTKGDSYSDGYPLCVINANAGNEPKITYGNDAQEYYPKDFYLQDIKQQTVEEQQYEQQPQQPNPLVNCIVVVKQKEEQSGGAHFPYNPWQQQPWPAQPYPQQQQLKSPWYGYSSTAYYGAPTQYIQSPPPAQPYFRSDASYAPHSNSAASGGYRRYSAYAPSDTQYQTSTRQEPSPSAQSVESLESQEISESLPPGSTTPMRSRTTPTPSHSRKTPAKKVTPTIRTPSIRKVNPIKHSSAKRKRPAVVKKDEEVDISDSADNVDETWHSAAATPAQSPHPSKSKKKTHKTAPNNQHYANDDDETIEPTEVPFHPNLRPNPSQIKRTTAATKYHTIRKETPTPLNYTDEDAPDGHHKATASDEVAAEAEYTEPIRQKHHKHPSAQHNHYADSSDESEFVETDQYPKGKRTRTTASSTHHHASPPSSYAEDSDSEEIFEAEETSSHLKPAQFRHSSYHPKPTARATIPKTSRPTHPQKLPKRKHPNNPATLPQQRPHPSEYPQALRPTSIPDAIKRDKPTAYVDATNNYANLAEYPHSSYQPALYPQQNYPSDYPKVSYVQPLSDPAPVYVNKSKLPSVSSHVTSKPSSQPPPKATIEFGIDSSEAENSAEFIKVRQPDYEVRLWSYEYDE